MKRLKLLTRVLALAVTLVVIFTACGSNGGSTTNTPNPNQKVNLTFFWWGDQTRHDATMAAIKIWNKEHPEIQVEGEFQGWDGYSAKLGTQFAAKVAPDIMQVSSNDLTTFAGNDLFLDLTPYKDTYFAGIDSTLWGNLVFNGKIAAVASGVNGSAMITNKTKALKYNLPLLTDDETQDTLFAKAKLATIDTNGDGKLDLWGTGDPMDTDPVTYNQFVRTFDLSVWTADLKGCQFTNPNIINILKKYEQFRKAKVIVPPDVSIMNGQSYMGLGVMEYSGTAISAYAGVLSGMTDEAVLTLDAKSWAGGKDLRAAGTGLPLTINKICKNPEAAVKFLSWFLTDPEAAKALGMSRSVFPSKSQRDAMKDSLNATDKSIVEVVSKLQALGNVPYEKVPNNYSNFLDIFTQEKNRYTLDQITLEQFMQNVQTSGAPVLAGN